MAQLTERLQIYQKSVQAKRQSSGMDYPLHVHIETFAQCNAACNFCPYPSLERKGEKMEDSLIQKVVEDLCDIPRLHKFQLSPFKVNEPFLDSRLFDILALFNERLPNASVTLTSNASPITLEKLKKLTLVRNLAYLWISFNDHREAEYEASMQLPYFRTIDRLNMIHQFIVERQSPFRVVLSRVGDGSSADADFVRFVKARFPKFESSIFPRGNWLGQISDTPDIIPAVGCIRWFDISITASGIVAHCCMDGAAKFAIGNVRTQHLLDIYNQPDFRSLRHGAETRLVAHPCNTCTFL